MMKTGDLVMFRNCTQVGKFGIISLLTKASFVAEKNPEMRIYWVLYDEGVRCFTGNQLVLV
tara:strand:+ start:5182 stop:5364 length:183 start_codon:yes stop_codon:yes gene_type:complete